MTLLEAGSDTIPLNEDDVHHILSNSRRRHIIQVLADPDAPNTIQIGDFATDIAARENQTTARDVTSDERKSVYVGLTQCHVPELAENDVINVDDRHTSVSATPITRALEEIRTDIAARLDGGGA